MTYIDQSLLWPVPPEYCANIELAWRPVVILLTLSEPRIVLAIVAIYGVRFFFFFSSRRRHTRFDCDWSSDVSLPISQSDRGRPRWSGKFPAMDCEYRCSLPCRTQASPLCLLHQRWPDKSPAGLARRFPASWDRFQAW